MKYNRPGGNGGVIAVIALLITLSIVWGALMLWWLVWSILDLANGNPATLWNIAGIVIPILSALGGGSRAR